MALGKQSRRFAGWSKPLRLWPPAALLCALSLFGGTVSAEDEQLIKETEIKAAFIYNFTKFVEWPAASFPGKGEPIVIGVLGETPLAAELAVIVDNRKVNGRPIVVTSVRTADELVPVQMLFVSATEDERFGALAPAISRNALLTVGESPAFAAADGAIVFVRVNGKLRFEINMTAAERAGLKVSGELQKLAAVVKRTP
jgi:hypothetical protein